MKLRARPKLIVLIAWMMLLSNVSVSSQNQSCKESKIVRELKSDYNTFTIDKPNRRQGSRSYHVGLTTNALYWLTTTPNAGVNIAFSRKFSLSAAFGYNAFNFRNHDIEKGQASNPKLHHWLFNLENKFWFSDVFNGSYLGLQSFCGNYNAGGIRFILSMKDHRYRGWLSGVGLTYGYQWALGKNWAVEASLGLGYAYLKYDKYESGKCGKYLGEYQKNYWGLTNLGVTFVYYIY